jgi:hypothetical protein
MQISDSKPVLGDLISRNSTHHPSFHSATWYFVMVDAWDSILGQEEGPYSKFVEVER